MKGHEKNVDKKQETKVIDLGTKETQQEQNLDSTRVMEGIKIPNRQEKEPVSELEQALRDTSEKLLESADQTTASAEKIAGEHLKKMEEQQSTEDMGASEDKAEGSQEDAPETQGKKIDLDAISDDEFLALYGEDTSEEKAERKEKRQRKKAKWINPIKIFKNNLTDESIDDETAKNMVNVIGIASGILFILVVGLAAMFIYSHYSSYSSQFRRGVEYENAGDMAKAASAYERAISAAGNKNDRIEGRLALANLYLDQHSDNNAAFYFEQVVDIDKGNKEAIQKLLNIYESNNNMQAILDLANKASGEDTQELFQDYLLNQPVFNYKSGTYDEKLMIEITAGEADRIYYTTDDTEATENSRLYSGPIQLEEGHTVFHAMAVNANGLMSQNIVVNYEIVAEAPQKPEISPNSGTYRELTDIEVTVPDGCRAYYTFDETVPTAESPEYTESIPMPMGNHIFSIIFINQNGVASEVAKKVYDFIFSAPVTKSEAINIVRDGLIASGELLNDSGEAADPDSGTAEFRCEDILTINDTQYYRVDKIYSGNGAFGSYGVEVNTGAVFTLLDDNGKYTLIGF